MAPRNLSRRLKVRLAAVITLAIVAAVVAWRSHPSGANMACTPGREEQRDSTGKLVRIVRTECLR
ncbi:hypothetical protein ACX40Y_07475 [Sphingomonas sp. RS6]